MSPNAFHQVNFFPLIVYVAMLFRPSQNSSSLSKPNFCFANFMISRGFVHTAAAAYSDAVT